MISFSEFDLNIFEMRFTVIAGKKSYVLHNVSKYGFKLSDGEFTAIPLGLLSLFDDFIAAGQAARVLRHR